MTQTQFIRHQLTRGPVCGTTLLKHGIPRYAARISELRSDGLNIVTEPCDIHWHHHTTHQIQYRLITDTELELTYA